MSDWLDKFYKPIALERVEVVQSGRVVGTVDPYFSPNSARSTSIMFDVRPGDFKLIDGKIRANKMLGYGDFMALDGFNPSTPASD